MIFDIFVLPPVLYGCAVIIKFVRTNILAVFPLHTKPGRPNSVKKMQASKFSKGLEIKVRLEIK